MVDASLPDSPAPEPISAEDRFRRFRERIPGKVLIFDGGMGTSLQSQGLPPDAFRGLEGCYEILNLNTPDAIRKVHDSFLEAGSDVVETNTFQGSRLKLAEHGLDIQTEEINRAAASIARSAVAKYMKPDHPRFVAGSMGPLGCLPSSGDRTLDTHTIDEILNYLSEQALNLVIGDGSPENPNGVDVLIIETGQDLLEMRQGVFAVDNLRSTLGFDIPLIVQFTLDSSGRTLLGSDVISALAAFLDLPVDVVGINCSTGPREMRESVRYLGEHAPMWVSALPNAGMPREVDGKLVWPLNTEDFASALKEFVGRFKVSIVGGCCGTRPEHIKAAVEAIGDWKPAPRPKERLQVVSSPLASVVFDDIPRPIIVGERLNAQGSKKAKQMVLADDLDGLFSLAQKQVNAGASILDVSVATTERDDEPELMERVAIRLSAGIPATMMIDSTDPEVVRGALRRIPGPAIVNSINFESGEEKARTTLELVKRYGSFVICMTIDEEGMALTPGRKLAVAGRIRDVALNDYNIQPDRLIFDALTLTLATGEEQHRQAAINTLEGLREIKRGLPGSYTTLGISNVSYGLPPSARKVLNSVFLYHAVRAGLDFAIVHAGQVLPYPTIPNNEKELAENLLFDAHEDALLELITCYRQKKDAPQSHPTINRLPADALRHAILYREKEGIEVLVERALKEHTPEEILNEILLPAMQEVGEKMSTGEIILPFVLQSAEVMKAAVARLEGNFSHDQDISRGKVVLATVAGDVHDIGKNLVKTILQNNGYEVCDLGKQVPNAIIVARAKECEADVIGLSALLITTSRHMEYCVEELHSAGLEIPVIIGGAAINRSFARRISWIGSEEIYKPGVYYAGDAFEGLTLIRGLLDTEKRPKLEAMAKEGALTFYKDRAKKIEEVEKKKTESATKAPGEVRHDNDVPLPPFWGPTLLATDVRDIFKLLDTKVLFKLNWAIRGRTAAEYHSMVSSTFQPLLEDLQEEARRRSWILPAGVYGYFPVNSDGQEVVVFDPMAHDDPLESEVELGRFHFPRQSNGERLCVADYFRPLETGERDILALQVVTMGERVAEVVQSFTQSGEYAKGFFLHGLAVESAEAMAEYLHRKIRSELGIDRGQGHRYSFGYPSTPDLSQQELIFKLLNAEEAIGTRLTSAYQIVPEQSTSALIVHHPDAKYFHIESEGLAAVLREPLG